MVVTTSVRALSWYYNVHACAPTFFVPYSIHKFRLMLPFYYWWLWHMSILMPYHLLSANYVHILIVNFYLFFLFLHAVSCTFSSCLQAWFYFSSFCLHSGFDLFFVRANLIHISNNRLLLTHLCLDYFLHILLPLKGGIIAILF